MAIERKRDMVYEYLKREILSKQLRPGHKFPREIELAKRLKVGQITLRGALARLEAEKLVVRIPGKGTFVSDMIGQTTFLLVLPDGTENLESPSRYVAAGIEEAAHGRAITIERCPMGLLAGFTERDCRETINRHRIGGVLLETGHARIGDALASRLKQLRLPVVIPHGLSGDGERTGFAVLRTDERAAFSDGFRYLKDRGHRRIAALLLRLPDEEPDSPRGFTWEQLSEFYRLNGLESPETMIGFVENQPGPIFEALQKWMFDALPPTAILCHSDRIAMRAFQLLKEFDVRIPGQVSLMGYSNYPGSQLLIPPLTTIDVQFADCGRMALEHLLDHEKWHQPGVTPPELFTPYKIIERGSVAAPPKRIGDSR